MRAVLFAVAMLSCVACGGGGGTTPPGPGPCTGPSCAPSCAATELACGGTCMDVADDPANCGACGHDCGGAACSAGVCMPATLAVVSNAPGDQLLVDGDDLVFATRGEVTSSGAIYRVSRTSGQTTTMYRGLADYPSVAVRADHSIVVADTAQVHGCGTQGTSGEIVALGAGVVSTERRCVGGLTVTSTGLAWIENEARNISGGNNQDPVISLLDDSAAPGTTPTALRTLPAGTILHVERVGDALIWTEGDLLLQSTNGEPRRVIATAADQILAFDADANDVAFLTVSGQLVVHSRSTGTNKTLAVNTMTANTIALDGSFVYTASSISLIAWDRRTGDSLVLASPVAPRVLAQDDDFIYFLQDLIRGTSHQTEVVRIRKPVTPLLRIPEPSVCAAPLETCPSGCVDTRTDLASCGSCGDACAPSEMCDGSACTCNENSLVCDGACVDQAIDPENCGACGHSCGSGTCVGGDCMPVMLASFGQVGMHDASAVYYAVNSKLYGVDASTLASSLVTTAPVPYNYLRYLAADDTHVYMAADRGNTFLDRTGCIYSVAKTGGAGPTTLYNDRSGPSYVATATNALVWVENTNTLVSAAPDGSGIHGTFSASTLYSGAADDFTVGIATAGSQVFWLLTDYNGNHGAVVKVDLAASQPQATLLTELDFVPSSIATDGTALFVAGGYPDGEVLSMPLAGGPITVLARGLSYPSMLTVAPGGGLLWDAGDVPGLVYDLEPGAAFPRVVQSGTSVDYTTGLFADADRLFTVSSNGVFVMQR